MPCSAGSLVHQNLALQESILCVVYALLLSLSHFSVQSSALTLCLLCAMLAVCGVGGIQAG